MREFCPKLKRRKVRLSLYFEKQQLTPSQSPIPPSLLFRKILLVSASATQVPKFANVTITEIRDISF
jgi:hypothetical protein